MIAEGYVMDGGGGAWLRLGVFEAHAVWRVGHRVQRHRTAVGEPVASARGSDVGSRSLRGRRHGVEKDGPTRSRGRGVELREVAGRLSLGRGRPMSVLNPGFPNVSRVSGALPGA